VKPGFKVWLQIQLVTLQRGPGARGYGCAPAPARVNVNDSACSIDAYTRGGFMPTPRTTAVRRAAGPGPDGVPPREPPRHARAPPRWGL
jgi:hypothetical protein